ncbi:metal cation transporting ATPase, P-type ATPase superfamily protein [Rhodococcus jostii RHA1]|uniref:Metal cation transporting ATPase, P-type ATPase superfamily protein n=1 Tax=Rhodococcus jostii (strain RHA1) TaxID=101510 RepID=Q0SBY7_RHOJR|nr:metal cation transporting ATPase, P-type ATPase superfamily protein [Rhodococcus jostii RHA1]
MSFPGRCVRTGTHAAAAGAAAALDATLVGTATALGVGSVLLKAPVAVPTPSPGAVARSVAGLAREATGGTPVRRFGSGSGRTWIEVRGLDGPHGPAVAERALSAVRAVPGVERAELHRPWSRLVVTVGPDGPSSQTLCRVVDEAETAVDTEASGRCPIDLPGDDAVLVARVVGAAVSTLGLGVALVGRFLRLPRLPAALASGVISVDYQPRLRRLVESAVGPDATDLLFAAATATAYTVTLSPDSLAIEAARRGALVAEAWSGRRAWQRIEPTLTAAVDGEPQAGWRPDRTTGPVERYCERAGLVGLAGDVAIGVMTRNPADIGTATLVSAPKATRTARELFAGTLDRGLADRHDVLPLRPEALRRLDRVDAVVIDPRVLYTPILTVSRVRGVRDRDRTRVWEAGRAAVNQGRLAAGWHPVTAVPGVADTTPDDPSADDDARVLVSPVHDPYASAIVAEARRAQAQVISIDDDGLRSLRNGFDRLDPITGSIDDTLRETVAHLQRDGTTVAVVTAQAPQALALADVGIGVTRAGNPPPWGAHLWAADLTGVWRILHALPAARTASRRGVQISVQASALGTLLMLPGIPGSGPESVTAGAAAGLWIGRAHARGVLTAPLPAPRPGHEWHAMPTEEVRRLLPPPAADSSGQEPQSVPSRSWSAPLLRMIQPLTAGWRFVRAVREELDDPLTPVLATCSAASAVLGSPIDAVLVGSVVVLNAGISATQRLRAEEVLNRLLAVQDPTARKIPYRETNIGGDVGYIEVTADRLRPGEVIEVRPGEVVPVDGRLLGAAGVEVDESALTGESLPVAKQTLPTPGVPLAERSCMLYAGTTVLTGTAVLLVTATGRGTETRRATALAPAKSREVGLQAQLSRLTRRAMPISFGGGAVVTGLGLLRGAGVRSAVTSGVAVIVAAVPEGLPLVATLAQMSAARRLTRSAALVRVPRSVEALGRVDVVCFDKTGTLSENRLRVSAVEPAPGCSRQQVLSFAARTGWSSNGGPPDHATDVAIVDAAHTESADEDRTRRAAYLPFRSGRSYAAAVSGTHLAVKGAPEVMLEAFGDADSALEERVQSMAAAGLRVIAVGGRELTPTEVAGATDDPAVLEKLSAGKLHPVGLLGLSDTPRADATNLLPALIEQDVAVRLITGDHPVTAVAIADELGMPVTPDQVISGTDWDTLPHREQELAVENCLVFARMSPEHKVQIVQTLERIGRVCAMVGDGANDAAAIRAASVGIAVASHGSAPARGAADVVLLDGKVGALLDALDEGRQLWRRVQAAVAVLVGGNAGEVAFALIGSAATGRSPLNARQLLLVNMLTDALPAAALAVSATNHNGADVTHGPDEAALLRTVAFRGATTAAGATAAWAMASVTGGPRRASTVALVALIGTQLGQILLDSRSPLVVTTSVGSIAVMVALISTPGVSQFLGCVPLGPLGWAQGFGSAAAATAAAAIAPDLLTRTPGIGSTIRELLHPVGNHDRTLSYPDSAVDVLERRKNGATPQPLAPRQ